MSVDLTSLRHEFTQGGLNRSDLDSNPFNQFDVWFGQAQDAGVIEPSAMSLATAGELELGIRTVLLKYLMKLGLYFLPIIILKKQSKLMKILKWHYCFLG